MANNNLSNISPELINSYQNDIATRTSPATTKRKLSSLKRFFDWAHKEGHVETHPIQQTPAVKIDAETVDSSIPQVTSGEDKKVSGKNIFRIGLAVGLVVLIFLLLGRVGIPIPFTKTPASDDATTLITEEVTQVTQPTTLSPWTIYSKTNLKDENGNPKVGSQNITYKIYNSEASSKTVFSTQKTVTADSEGNIKTIINDVPREIFFENEKLFLTVSVDGQESATKIPISTANQAANLSGYFAGSPEGSTASTVPILSKDGSLLLASEAPAVKATEGSLLVEGQTVTIASTEASDGDISFNPDGSGIAHFLFEGTGQNFLNAQAPNLYSGSLYYGSVANNNTGYDLLRLQSGSTPITRFAVDALGNTNVGGQLLVAGDILTKNIIRLTSAGALTNITGYSQASGNFSITQGEGDTAGIIKQERALSDVLTLTLDERGKGNSIYSTLTLKRYDGAVEGAALFVDEGNAIFDGQLRLGRFASNPTAIGSGTMIYNSTDNKVYVWNGSTWTAVGTGTGYWSQAFGVLYPSTTTDDLAVGGTDSTAPFFVDDLGNVTIDGNTTIGDTSGDIVTSNADSWTFTNDTNLTLSGGVNGFSFDTDTLSIDAANNRVGIGTTTPDYPLTVYHATNGGLGHFQVGDSGNSELRIQNVTTSWYIGQDSSEFFRIRDETDNRLVIDTSGNVGINTTGPDRKLDVLDASNPQLRLTQADGTVYADFQVDSNGDLTISATGGDFNFSDGTNTLVAIKDQGVYPFLNLAGKTDTGDPGTCAEGDIYYNAFDDTLSVCHAGNSWEQLDASGGGTSYWTYSAPFLYPTNTTDQVAIGTTTTAEMISQLYVTNGSILGKALAIFNQTESEDILTASASGIAKFTVSNAGDLALEGAISDITNTAVQINDNLQINQNNILDSGSATRITLGTTTTITANITALTQDLTVGDNTTLGATAIDAITFNARVYQDSDLVPYGTAGENTLGNEDYGWDQVHADLLDVAGAAHVDYSRFGANTTTHSGNLTTGDDVLLSGDVEVDGTFFLDGGVLSNVVGTAALTLAADPINNENVLSASSWLIENTANVGKAALMVNQTKSGPLFTASASGVTRFTLANDGAITQNANSLSTGDGYYLESTSTSFSSGNLMSLYWNPGSATTATGDLLRLNVGADGVLGNVLNVLDNGSSLFSVSQTAITSALPHSFTAPGDITAAYDFIFTNQTTSKIESYAPLEIEVGESFENNDLTITTYGTGNIIANMGGTSSALIPGTDDTHDIGNSSYRWDDIYATNATIQTSDIRLKENITALGYGLDTLMQLNPITYTWINRPDRGTKVGFIAQEVQPLIPEVVDVGNNSEKTLGLRYSDFVPILTKAIQEQQFQIEELVLNSVGEVELTENNEVVTIEGEKVENSAAFAEIVVGNIKAGIIRTGEFTSSSITAFTAQVDNLLVATGLVSPRVETSLISPLADGNITIQLGSSESEEPGKLAIVDRNEQEVASIDEEGNAVFDGKLSANEITTNEIRAKKIYVDEIIGGDAPTLEEIEALLAKVEKDQGLLNEAESWSISSATGSANLTDVITSNLYVTNNAAINMLSITESFAIGADFIIQASLGGEGILPATSINTLSAPLQIQSLALAPIELMAGLIRIDTQGNVQITGNLYIAGRIEAEGLTLRQSESEELTASESARLLAFQDKEGRDVALIDASGSARFVNVETNKLIIAGSESKTTSNILGTTIQTNATAGTATLPAGETAITIKNPNVTDATLIYVTPLSSTQNKVLYIKSKESCVETVNGELFEIEDCAPNFVVGFNQGVLSDVKFNWWMVDLTSPVQ